MTKITSIVRLTLLLAAATLPAACAQPSQPEAQMNGMKMNGMGNMQGHDMAGMDMSSMMKHCADMRQGMSQGQMSPDMQKMMTQCDQMNHGMGTAQSVPDTRSR